MAKEGFIITIPKPKEPKKEPTPQPTQAIQIVEAQNNYPQSNYEDTYKTAGEKYGIPWQILYGIHMTETGCRNGAIMNGSGSGAQGPMQFMPGTWRAYGVDGDGDGIADINNAIDAINGAANYLAKHGSLDNGLRSYGGNYSGTLAYARAKGYNL
jgi:membrane-bound lytic murein transglycosylase B